MDIAIQHGLQVFIDITVQLDKYLLKYSLTFTSMTYHGVLGFWGFGVWHLYLDLVMVTGI